MTEAIVVTRYAQAFAQFVRDAVGLEEGISELLNLRQVLSDNPAFRDFLESPDFSCKEKFAVIDRVIEGNFIREIGYFLKLLIEKGRIRYLTSIMEYARIHFGRGEMVAAVMSSAFLIDDDLIQSLKRRLEKKIKRPINLYVTFDATLLGGVKVTIGNQVFDGSLRRQLVEIRRQMMSRKLEWRTQ